MCEPTTLAVLSIASTAASVYGQKTAADAQAASNQVQYQNSMIARGENANQVNLERQQQADAASQKIDQNNMAARSAQATAVATGGPSGISMDALLASIGGKQASYNDSVYQNLDRVNLASDNQLVNVNRRAASEINSLQTPAAPDYLGAALKIGQAGYNYKKGTA